MSFFTILFCWIIVLLALYFFVLTLINMLWMKHETKKATLTTGPFISVLVPARDEEFHIIPCIESLMHQTYSNYEVLVLDDNSTDKTRELLDKMKTVYPERLRIFSGKTLPDGWRGKPFAMQQLCDQALGEYLLFTDADTIHSSFSLSLSVTNMLYHKVDFLSGYIKQQTKTIGEKMTIPLMYLLSFFILPLWVCKWGKSPILAAAIGQYICVKKDSFFSAGGFEQVKNCTTEDVYLARSMKEQGYKTVFLDLKDAAMCRMYTSWKSCVVGISKNIFDFLGKNNILLVFMFLGILIFLTIPPFLTCGLTIIALFFGYIPIFILLSFWVSTAFMWAAWVIVFKSEKFNWLLSFMYPVFFVNLLYIAIISWTRSLNKKGHAWKGRIVH